MHHRDTLFFRATVARRGLRLFLAAAVLAAVSLGSHVGRADETSRATAAPTAPPAAAAPTAAELRGRFGGLFRYSGSAAEQAARTRAIERSAAPYFFAVRGMVRSKLEDRTRIMPHCRFEFVQGNIRSTVPGHAVAVSPETGAPAPYRVDDDAIVLTQRLDTQRLVQVFRADEGGTRTNEFTLSQDGALLVMKATLTSPKLSIPVVYTLTYRRAES